MKALLFLAAAAAVLSTTAAQADNGQRFDWAAQERAYSNTLPRDLAPRCFNGQYVTGANRSGATTVYVQSNEGGIYRLKMADGCAAMDDATRLTVRSNGSDIICPGEAVEAIAWTSAGAQTCKVRDVRHVTGRERAALAKAPRR